MKELREWIQLLFVVVGGIIALFAYFQNLKQRRVENSLKFIALFRDALQDGDLGHWANLMHLASEPAGSPPGHFYHPVRNKHVSIGEYFSEGSSDSGAIARMAGSLNIVCHQVLAGAADARTVYYELGQLLNTMHEWLTAIPSAVPGQSLLAQAFPNIQAFVAKYKPITNRWPCRVFAFAE